MWNGGSRGGLLEPPPPFETKLFHFHGDIFEKLGKISNQIPHYTPETPFQKSWIHPWCVLNGLHCFHNSTEDYHHNWIIWWKKNCVLIMFLLFSFVFISKFIFWLFFSNHFSLWYFCHLCHWTSWKQLSMMKVGQKHQEMGAGIHGDDKRK